MCFCSTNTDKVAIPRVPILNFHVKQSRLRHGEQQQALAGIRFRLSILQRAIREEPFQRGRRRGLLRRPVLRLFGAAAEFVRLRGAVLFVLLLPELYVAVSRVFFVSFVFVLRAENTAFAEEKGEAASAEHPPTTKHRRPGPTPIHRRPRTLPLRRRRAFTPSPPFQPQRSRPHPPRLRSLTRTTSRRQNHKNHRSKHKNHLANGGNVISFRLLSSFGLQTILQQLPSLGREVLLALEELCL